MLRMVVAILLAINLALLLWVLKQPAQPEPPVVGGDLKLLSELASQPEPLVPPPAEPPVVSVAQKEAPQPEPPPVTTQTVEPVPVVEAAKPEGNTPVVSGADHEAPAAASDQQPAPVPVVRSDQLNKPQTPAQEPPETAPAEKKTPPSYCYAYGPMPDQPAGLPVLGEIRRKFPDAQLRQEGQDEKGVFWVLIESAKSDIESVQLEEQLRAAGISDIWRVTRGERRNAVSMGVFNQKENAEKRASEAKVKGFDAKVVNKRKEGKGFWVEFTSERNNLTPAALGVAANADRFLRTRPCGPNGQAPVQSP